MAAFWCCFYNYIVEFFPVSILSIGFGIPAAFGGLGMAACQIVFITASEENLNSFHSFKCFNATDMLTSFNLTMVILFYDRKLGLFIATICKDI